MGTKKAGTKRGREEVETSSKGSRTHPIAQTNVKRLKRWKREKYIPIYLTLLDEVVNKTISFDGPMWTCRFWVWFTAEFNKRVKESITKPRFEDFEIEEVIKYGEELWQAYNENKNKEVVMLKDFHLYEKAFKHYDRFSNPPSFSKSSKRPRGSNYFTSTNRSSGSLETTSSINNGELKEALDQLSHLRRSGKLSLEHLKEAVNNFKENAEVPYLWLRLSLEDQVMWIKEHL